jgi:branched-chain amino acid transport system substrate-binding protein
MAERPARISRRKFVQGVTAAGVGGLVVGGAAGYFASPDGEAVGTSGGTAGGQEDAPLKIGSASPTTGAYSGDGEEMVRGQTLALEEINDAGGLSGRPLELVVVDTKDLSPENMVSAMRRLVDQEQVAAIFAGYTSTTSAEYDVPGQSGTPMFHLNTLQSNVDYAADNGYTNIFQGDPSEIWYGRGLASAAQSWVQQGLWRPSSKTVALVSSTDPYSISIADNFRDTSAESGWRTSLYEKVTAPTADWGGILARIRNNPPGIIFVTDYIPGDLAAFAKQFASSPTPSLLIQQYGPSVPEYLRLAGEAANGVIWSTVIGTIPDSIGEAFKAKYQERFDAEAGLSQAGGEYDMVYMWAQAATQAGDPYDFEQVALNVRNTAYRGVSGAYTFGPNFEENEELAATQYPDQTNDPSLGMPMLTFQIQDLEQVLIAPDPYTQGKFQLPSWLDH